MDNPIKIGHIELGEILEEQGDAWVIRTRRSGILMPVLFWLAGALAKEKEGPLNPIVLERQLRGVLDTPDGWRQLNTEWAVYRESMRLLRKMSSNQLAAYLAQRRARYWDLLGIDSLDGDILSAIMARGGKTDGLPSALSKVLGEEIQEVVQGWISSKYIEERGTQNLLTSHWGKKGIQEGLRRLPEINGLNFMDFLLKYVEKNIEEGYDSRVNPPQPTGPKDVLNHKSKLISLDKPLRLDHTVYAQREDEERGDAYILKLKDRIGDRHLDEQLEAEKRLQQILEELTDEQRHIVMGTDFRDDNAKTTAGRQRRSRTKRKVLDAFRAAETSLKKRRGRPKKTG